MLFCFEAARSHWWRLFAWLILDPCGMNAVLIWLYFCSFSCTQLSSRADELRCRYIRSNGRKPFWIGPARDNGGSEAAATDALPALPADLDDLEDDWTALRGAASSSSTVMNNCNGVDDGGGGESGAASGLSASWDAYFGARSFPSDLGVGSRPLRSLLTEPLCQVLTVARAMAFFFNVAQEDVSAHQLGSDRADGDGLLLKLLRPEAPPAELNARPALPAAVTIHVIGAGPFEAPATGVWEELLHIFPQIQSLNVVFVGPAIPLDNGTNSQSEQRATDASGGDSSDTDPDDDEEGGTGKFAAGCEMRCCAGCRASGRRRWYSYFPMPYHDYRRVVARELTDVADADKASAEGWVRVREPPTLCAMFNSGMHEAEVELWTPTLLQLRSFSSPFVFTGYNALEIRKDVAALRCVQLLWRPR